MISDYFTDEELETQIRQQFEPEEMWDIDFKTIFGQIEDNGGDYFELKLRNRTFHIDKITAAITEIGGDDTSE